MLKRLRQQQSAIVANITAADAVTTAAEPSATIDEAQAEKMAGEALAHEFLSRSLRLVVVDALKACSSSAPTSIGPMPPSFFLWRGGLAVDIFWRAINAKQRHWLKRRAASYGDKKLTSRLLDMALLNAQEQLQRSGLGHFELSTLRDILHDLLPEWYR